MASPQLWAESQTKVNHVQVAAGQLRAQSASPLLSLTLSCFGTSSQSASRQHQHAERNSYQHWRAHLSEKRP